MNQLTAQTVLLLVIVGGIAPAQSAQDQTSPRVDIVVRPAQPPPAWQGTVDGNIPPSNFSMRKGENLQSALLRQRMPDVWLEFSKSRSPRDLAAENSARIKVKLPTLAVAILKEYWIEVIKFDYAEAFVKPKTIQERADRLKSQIYYSESIVNKLRRVEIHAPDGKRTISYEEAGAIIMFVHQASIDLVNRVKERLPKLVANLWTEFSAHRSEALATNGKELQNP